MQRNIARFVIGKQHQICLLVAGVLSVELCVSHCRAQDTGDWYPFAPRNTAEPGEIGMQDWLEKPAGLHGRIVRRDDKLFYNGRAIKLWGLNNTYSACAPAKELADQRAAFYPKYGYVNDLEKFGRVQIVIFYNFKNHGLYLIRGHALF